MRISKNKSIVKRKFVLKYSLQKISSSRINSPETSQIITFALEKV